MHPARVANTKSRRKREEPLLLLLGFEERFGFFLGVAFDRAMRFFASFVDCLGLFVAMASFAIP